MERLTKRNNNGYGYLVKVKDDEQEVDSPYKNTLKALMESIQKLTHYEDTGLTPEEIKSLHNKYGLLLSMYESLQKDCDYWKRESIKWADKLGEIRIFAADSLCDK